MKTSFQIILKEVTSFLDNKLSKHLTYHDTAHTLYVLEKAIHIAEKEKVKRKDLLLVKTAALYHDIGFVKTHLEHEKESCKIASKQLKSYGYSKNEIDIVCGMIMATKIPQNPTNHLGKILADADLEYLATSKFKPVSDLLFMEMKHFDTKLTIKKWNTIQIDFISNHSYHTKFCKHYKSFRKLNNLEKLKLEL